MLDVQLHVKKILMLTVSPSAYFWRGHLHSNWPGGMSAWLQQLMQQCIGEPAWLLAA